MLLKFSSKKKNTFYSLKIHFSFTKCLLKQEFVISTRLSKVNSKVFDVDEIHLSVTVIINALRVQIPRHNTFLLLTLDTSCYPVGTHKHDRHLELHNANDTTLNKETMHSKAVINFKKLLKLLYNTSRMKQVLMLRYKSTKCSKHYEYTNGKKRSQFTYFFLDTSFSRRDKK